MEKDISVEGEIEPPSAAESRAELEVVKAILNREGYLSRLHKSAKTIHKKFKPEIADILDFVRAASLDVAEAIVKWREVKGNHDAIFVWDRINYLLKMPSDMDFLDDYLAIRKWMGFTLVRNPYCIPFPMDDGLNLLAERLLDPKNIELGNGTDGFAIGGMSEIKLRKKYTTASRASAHNKEISPYGSAVTLPNKGLLGGGGPTSIPQSFILNNDMKKIRQAEMIMLKEEEKHGRFSRDPEGRIVPYHQAETRKIAQELKKDVQRALTEPALTLKYAPHAANCEVGVSEETWVPEEGTPNKLLSSDKLRHQDSSVVPAQRGETKSGGLLAPLTTSGAPSRIRRPLKPTLGSGTEFNRARMKKTLGDRLAEISLLKQQLTAARQTAEEERARLSRSAHNSRNDKRRKPPSAQAVLSATSQAAENRPVLPTVMMSQTTPNLLSHLAADAVDSRGGSAPVMAPSSPSALRKSRDLAPRARSPAATSATRLSMANELSFEDLTERLAALEEEEQKVHKDLAHVVKDEVKMTALKISERNMGNRERSRELERKRRLLSETEGRRAGPPPNEPHNVYDYYATRAQAAIRGWLARCFVKWYRKASVRACCIIQAYLRGWFGRMKVRRKRLQFKSAQYIQKCYRGWRARGVSASLAKKRNLTKSTVVIQRTWRGVLGKRRAQSKKQLDLVSQQALMCVDPRILSSNDVRELGIRIQSAIDQPLICKYPPDEVLHLMRIITLIIQGIRGNLGLAEYTFINSRFYREVDGECLSWMDAAKVANRQERLIRIIRALAYGPGAKPPRLLQLPSTAQLLYTAQLTNPRWSLATFENMGAGAKFCCQMFKWLTSIAEISLRQQEFLTFIASSFPDWLPKLFELQQTSRKCEFELFLNKRCADVLDEHIKRSEDDASLKAMLEREMVLLNREMHECKIKLLHTTKDIEKLGSDQGARETYATAAMRQKLDQMKSDLEQIVVEYTTKNQLCAQGDLAAKASLSDVRMHLTNEKLVLAEMEAQYKLLEIQCAGNVNRRKDPGQLSLDIKAMCIVAGETKALHLVAANQTKVMLRSAGVKHPQDLLPHFVGTYTLLSKTEDDLRIDARRQFVLAENARKSFDIGLSSKMTESQNAENKSKDKMMPSDIELQEEREEDEHEARLERSKMLQYIPGDILNKVKVRSRPVVIALARDLPSHAKQHIHAEITRCMPGVFVCLDVQENMGLNLTAMQSILDAKKSIIMSVDHGLTRLTRTNFMKNLDMTVKALIPNPFVALAMGEDSNKRNSSGTELFGVHKNDLRNMRDGDIKRALEGIAWVVQEFSRADISKEMQRIASEILPPSRPFLLVLEAFFIAQSSEDKYYSPDRMVAATSWRLTQRLLMDPRNITKALSAIKRGSMNMMLCECLFQYMMHPLWPAVNCEERSVCPVLHLLAYYVEQVAQCGKWTLDRGGAASTSLTKGGLACCQAVVVVRDSYESADLVAVDKSCGWRVGAARLIRAALQDLRVIKTALKIDNHLYNVSAYREESLVFFDVYDPDTSHVDLTSFTVDTIPFLLMPNAFGASMGVDVMPPTTDTEMYLRLAKLLKFERSSKKANARKLLVCKREFTFLERRIFKLDGHRIFLNCFEACLGELYFTAYLPEHCCSVNVILDGDTRLKLLHNADPVLEFAVVDAQDARLMLQHVIDRLRISPSITMSRVRSSDLRTGRFKNKEPDTTRVQSQGFSLRIRCRGGPGRFLMKKVVIFSGVQHILVVKKFSETKLLRICVYEPQTRRSMEVRVCHLWQRLLLKDNDDVKTWYGDLVKRLRLDWKGEHSVRFDCTLIKMVRKLLTRQMLISVCLVDENSVLVILNDSMISENYSCLVTKEQVIRLIRFVPPVDSIQQDFGISSDQPAAVKNVIKGMTVKQKKSKVGSEKSGHIDPTEFDAMIDRVVTKDNLRLMIQHLVFLAQFIDNNNPMAGYKITGPVNLMFARDDKPAQQLDMNTSLRYVARLKHGPRECTTEGVITSRRQTETVQMESELNALAMKRSQEAMARIVADLRLTESVEQSLLSLQGESDDLLQHVIHSASKMATSNMLESIEQKVVNRMVERAQPGTTQEVHRQVTMFAADGKNVVEVDADQLNAEDRAILGRGEFVVFEAGVKTNYREGRARWHGHVSVKVHETMCWMGDDGPGRRLRFVVFEPGMSKYFEGVIRSSKHLREVLGLHGQDLMDKKKTTEMLLFVLKYRMDVVKNFSSAVDAVIDENEPEYLIEFQSDRLFNADKVTPVNAGGAADAAVNSTKLIDLAKMRGQKLLRLVRRISGLLMQLTVFEIPTEKREAKKKISKRGQESVQASVHEDSDAEDDENDAASLNESLAGSTIASMAKGSSVAPIVPKFEPPTLRIIGYDPRSKRKAICVAVPEAILEIAGGIYSPFLDPKRRLELATVVGESLVLFFPRGKPFEMVVPWAGSHQEVSNAVVSDKTAWRSSAEKVIKRPNKLFQAAMRVCKLEVVVTVFSHQVQSVMPNVEPEKQVIVNVYSKAVSEAAEIMVTEKDQVDRMGRAIANFADGAVQAAAIRRFCRYLRADLVEDPDDINKKILLLDLLAPKKDFLTEYQQVRSTEHVTEESRPVGVPAVFMPLDTCGTVLQRRGMKIANKSKRVEPKDYIVTVYTKSVNEDPERGLVIKLYERGTSYTAVLHVGPSELMRLCDLASEPDLIRDMTLAKQQADADELDYVEKTFEAVTAKGGRIHAYKKLVDLFVNIIVNEVGIQNTPDQKIIPYLRSSGYGVPPN